MDPSTGRPPPTLSRAEVLRALSVAFSEPHVLVDALQTANSDEDAVDAVCWAFGLSRIEASTVLDQRIGLITRAHVTAMRDELERGPQDHRPEGR